MSAARLLAAGMALLFGFAALLQWNDPDPLRWIAAYGCAAGLAARYAWTRAAKPSVCFAVAAALGLWSLSLLGSLWGAEASTFTRFEMTSPGAEQARECLGLVIAAAYLTLLGVSVRRAP